MASIIERYDNTTSSLPEEVTLVAVSKTKPVEDIQAAYDAGHRDFGENRAREMRDKQEELPDDINWHMVGPLQTNKVKYIIDYVHLIQSVDRIKVLKGEENSTKS